MPGVGEYIKIYDYLQSRADSRPIIMETDGISVHFEFN